nr:glutamate receptor ionotropic, kainate 2-like [Cherax quadricarinatus]
MHLEAVLISLEAVLISLEAVLISLEAVLISLEAVLISLEAVLISVEAVLISLEAVLISLEAVLISLEAVLISLEAVLISLHSGGLFDSNERQEVAFRYAVDAINSDRTLMAHTRLSAQIEEIPPNDSFKGSRKVCSLLNTGVAAIFGPQSGQTSDHVQSICDALEIPHIENRWDFRLSRDAYSVNLYPHPSTLSKVMHPSMHYWNMTA